MTLEPLNLSSTADPSATPGAGAPIHGAVVTFTGELDLATRDRCFDAIIACCAGDVIVDMTATTFMDCGGYRSIVDARLTLSRDGRSVEVVNATGDPALLLDLIARARSTARSPRCGDG